VVAKQHFQSPRTDNQPPATAARGGLYRPPHARYSLLLIDFLANARNLPPITQRFVNVGPARLVATLGTNQAKLR
jgi:hypothetical protein